MMTKSRCYFVEIMEESHKSVQRRACRFTIMEYYWKRKRAMLDVPLRSRCKRSRDTVLVDSARRRSGRLQLAERKKKQKVHREDVDLETEKEKYDEEVSIGQSDNGSSEECDDAEDNSEEDNVSGKEVPDSDDDFANPPKKAVSKPSSSALGMKAGNVNKRKKEGITTLKAKYMRIKSRASPNVLQKVVDNLNIVQKREVVRIGFGSLLQLKISELPARLGLWLVQKFNPRSSSIEVSDHTKVRVTVDDVDHVLGLPRGRVKIVNRRKGEKCDIVEAWMAVIGKKENKITPLELCDKVLQYTEGGVWFVRLFVMLAVSVLVDSPSHGHVNSAVLKSLEDVEGIRSLNWCEYVHRSLINSKMKWEQGTSKYFTGPLLFLMVFYVDRVVLYKRDVERTPRAFLGWNSKLLRDRENMEVRAGGFGMGYEDGAYTGEKLNLMLVNQWLIVGVSRGMMIMEMQLSRRWG